MTSTVFVLNGPNMNMLGVREPEKYGRDTIVDLHNLCLESAAELGLEARFLQSNAEHQLIDWIHEARNEAVGIVINPAGYTHSSIALRDALATFEGPIVEVHITNIHKREEFRHHSYVSGIASGVICGCGIQGYEFALAHIAKLLTQKNPNKLL